MFQTLASLILASVGANVLGDHCFDRTLEKHLPLMRPVQLCPRTWGLMTKAEREQIYEVDGDPRRRELVLLSKERWASFDRLYRNRPEELEKVNCVHCRICGIVHPKEVRHVKQ
jgi:hypothetical protein